MFVDNSETMLKAVFKGSKAFNEAKKKVELAAQCYNVALQDFGLVLMAKSAEYNIKSQAFLEAIHTNVQTFSQKMDSLAAVSYGKSR